MRYFSFLFEKYSYDDYRKAGISASDVGHYIKYQVKPEYAAYYKNVDEFERDRIRGVLRRAENRAIDKLASSLEKVRKGTGPISYRTACALIADDDELWEFLVAWSSNAEEAEDIYPEATGRFAATLKRMTPIHKHLYRGQQPFRIGDGHARGFHSWSENRETAELFAERTGRVLEIDRPIQGVSLSDLCTWRMRLRDGESHYCGSQSEWLVLDQPEQFHEGRKEWHGMRDLLNLIAGRE